MAPQLNERISEVVWKESMEQADQMIQYMLSQPDSSSREGIAGVRSIAINVLGQVGYRDADGVGARDRGAALDHMA